MHYVQTCVAIITLIGFAAPAAAAQDLIDQRPIPCDIVTMATESSGVFISRRWEDKPGFVADIGDGGRYLVVVAVFEPALPRTMFKMKITAPSDSAQIEKLRARMTNGSDFDGCVPVNFSGTPTRLETIELRQDSLLETMIAMMIEQDQESTRRWQAMLEQDTPEELVATIKRFEKEIADDPELLQSIVLMAPLEAARERLAAVRR